MKLAEAPARRADLTTRIAELRGRALSAAQHQEGDEPVEDPAELLAEADRAATELETLIVAINATNLSTELADGVSVTAALARRDVLRLPVPGRAGRARQRRGWVSRPALGESAGEFG